MKGEILKYQNFTIYPECCGYDTDELLDLSEKDTQYHIAAVPVNSQIMAVVTHENILIYARAKHRLHAGETQIKAGSEKPETINLDGKNVLILICYEIMFPEDWLQIKEKIDLVIHMVGFPMLDENQKEGWIALQKCLSLTYNCPVACCCGGERNQMNITGILEPNKT